MYLKHEKGDLAYGFLIIFHLSQSFPCEEDKFHFQFEFSDSIEGLRAITTRDARSIVRLFFSQIRWREYYLKYEIAKY